MISNGIQTARVWIFGIGFCFAAAGTALGQVADKPATPARGMGTLEHYVSNKAVFVGYVEADKVKSSAFYKTTMAGNCLAEMENMILREGSIVKIIITDVTRLLVTSDAFDDDGIVVIFEFAKDKPLSKIVDLELLNKQLAQRANRRAQPGDAPVAAKAEIKTYKGVEYVSTSSYRPDRGFIAHLAKGLYCFVENEVTLKAAIDRAAKGKPPIYNQVDFKTVMDHVRKDQAFFAMTVPAELKQEITQNLTREGFAYLGNVNAFSIGGNLGGGLALKAKAIFDSAESAKKFETNYKDIPALGRTELRRALVRSRERLERYKQSDEGWEIRRASSLESEISVMEKALEMLWLMDNIKMVRNKKVCSATLTITAAELAKTAKPMLDVAWKMMQEEINRMEQRRSEALERVKKHQAKQDTVTEKATTVN